MALFDLEKHEEALKTLSSVKGSAGDLEEQISELEKQVTEGKRVAD